LVEECSKRGIVLEEGIARHYAGEILYFLEKSH
jgi:hypothetical protein